MLPLTPTKLGRYEIVDEIGKGAMGVVYLARDPLIGRLVALKTFRSNYSIRDQEMEQFRARFIREAQSAGILSHPNIVTIHDVVEESEDGSAFIAMEYVRGTNLKALLQGDQPLSLPFVVDVIAQVADALDYAHSNRVIHRDVKPANILITADNRVKITDFGIARIDNVGLNLTQAGQLLGTPNYMAPEQIQGKDVDFRADHFALGVVLYEMLTRHKPFQGENLTVVSHRIVFDHFTPPREFVRELPPGIEPILDRALEKDPARRYQRAKEMVEDLRRVAGALAGADLNETQSMAGHPAFAVPGPGAASADPTGSTGWTGPSSWRPQPPPLPGGPAAPPLPPPIPSAAAPAAAAAPQPAAKTTPRQGSPGPLLKVLVGVAGALLLLALLAGGGWWFFQQWKGSKAARSASVIAVSPERPPKLEVAVPPPVQPTPVVDQERTRLLEAAQQALDSRHPDEAVSAAKAALERDPNDGEAKRLLEAAQTAQARVRAASAARARRERTESPIASVPTPSPAPAPVPAQPAAPVSQEATLRMSFESELGGASVMVFVGSTKVWQTTIGGGGGLLHRDQGGRADKTVSVHAGSADLKVYVTPPGQAAVFRPISGSFLGGSTRSLTIRLPASKVPAIDLR